MRWLSVAVLLSGCVVTTDENLWKVEAGSPDQAVVESGVDAHNVEGSVQDGPVQDGPLQDAFTGDGDLSIDAPTLDSATDTDKLPLGQPCSTDGECASVHCIDGVCCASVCGGLCEACDLSGSEGTCTVVSAGKDPDKECSKNNASTCQQDGTCDGKGACRLHVQGTACGPDVCVQESTRNKQCDGQGTCSNSPLTSCLPYKCNTNTGACRTSCSSDNHCVAYRCNWFGQKCRDSCTSTSWHCQSGYTCTNNLCTN